MSHIPDTFGGAASDRMLIERSSLTAKLDPGDSLMTDKGFQAQDIFAPVDVTVNTPTFLKKRNQFTAKSSERDRRIASKRVHVKRLICLAKTYKILSTSLNNIETALGSRILFRCFMLYKAMQCLQCFDAVGWAAGRASGL